MKIKRCPFCGGKAVSAHYRFFGWKVFCDNNFDCEVIPATEGGFKTEEDAIIAWNTRYNEIPTDAEIDRILDDLDKPFPKVRFFGERITEAIKTIKRFLVKQGN